MKTSSLFLIVIAVVLAVSLLSIWVYPSIQDFMSGNTMWNGIKSFDKEYSVENLDSLDNLASGPSEQVLVVIPYLEFSQADLDRISKFVQAGNTLVLMDDFGYGNSILQNLGLSARFENRILLDPLFCYKNEYLPRITDFSAGLKEQGLEAIVFNHATVLSQVDNSEALAWSSANSFLDSNQNGKLDQGEPAGPFAVAAELHSGKGTVKLVSDPSIVINSMIGENNNSQFTRYLVATNGTTRGILLDRGHLSKSPLDSSKISLTDFREFLSNPYILVGLIALLFVIIIRYTLKKGEIFG
jgi:hypothetical protein